MYQTRTAACPADNFSKKSLSNKSDSHGDMAFTTAKIFVTFTTAKSICFSLSNIATIQTSLKSAICSSSLSVSDSSLFNNIKVKNVYTSSLGICHIKVVSLNADLVCIEISAADGMPLALILKKFILGTVLLSVILKSDGSLIARHIWTETCLYETICESTLCRCHIKHKNTDHLDPLLCTPKTRVERILVTISGMQCNKKRLVFLTKPFATILFIHTLSLCVVCHCLLFLEFTGKFL